MARTSRIFDPQRKTHKHLMCIINCKLPEDIKPDRITKGHISGLPCVNVYFKSEKDRKRIRDIFVNVRETAPRYGIGLSFNGHNVS